MKDRESRQVRIPQRCLELLIDLRDYDAMTDQTPLCGPHETMTAKWQRYRATKRE